MLRLRGVDLKKFAATGHLSGRALLVIALVLAGLWSNAVPRTAAARTVAHRVEGSAPAQSTSIRAVVGSGGTSLLEAPGGNVLRELPVGENLSAIGRSVDSLWTAVRTSDETAGWVATADLLMFGGSQLPVLASGDRLEAGDGSTGPIALPTPTLTPEATVTPVPSPTPVATATPTAAQRQSGGTSSGYTPTASQVAVVRSGGSHLVDVPGGRVLQTLPTGTAVTVSGRTEDTAWLAAITAHGARGWLPAADVVTFNVDRLPVGVVGADDAADSATPPTQDSGMSTASSGGMTDSTATGGSDMQVTASVALTDSRLNVRSGPDVAYRILAKALPDEQYSAVGQSEDSSWIQVTGDKLGTGTGWVAEEYVILSSPRARLPVVDADSILAPAVSPDDGSSLSLPVAPARPLATQPGLSGYLVVQTRMGGDIYVVDLETGNSRYLVSGFDPAISPDGTTVAFTRDGGEHGLYLIGIDGANERRIYSGGEALRGPTWSHEGGHIVFSRVAGEWECRDVGFGVCLPDNPFLSGFPMSTRPETGLSRVNTDGGDFKDLPALTSAKAPSWSQGGVAYSSNSGIEITGEEHGATTRVVLNAPYYQDPDWQPVSDRIAFHSREGSHWEIFNVNQDGNGLFAMTKPVTTLVDELPSNVSPAWSPDGQYVVYLSSRDDRNDTGDWRLWVMNADGSEQRPLGIDLPLDYSHSVEQVVDWGVKPIN